MLPPPGWNPYSRAQWAEGRLQFRPPPDGATVSTRLSDYATAEEIELVTAVLEQARRELNGHARGARTAARMSAAAQDAALAALWAATDRRRLGWILGYLREDVVHSKYRDHAGLLPEGSARELLRQFYARYELAQAAAGEDRRREWVPPLVDDIAWEDHLRWLALRDVRFSREWLLPQEKRLPWSRQHQLIRERQNRFLEVHPEYLEAARRRAEEAA